MLDNLGPEDNILTFPHIKTHKEFMQGFLRPYANWYGCSLAFVLTEYSKQRRITLRRMSTLCGLEYGRFQLYAREPHRQKLMPFNVVLQISKGLDLPMDFLTYIFENYKEEK